MCLKIAELNGPICSNQADDFGGTGKWAVGDGKHCECSPILSLFDNSKPWLFHLGNILNP